jgi:hypothetical protein
MESSRFHSYLKNRILDLPYHDACTWSIRRAVLGYMDCQNIFIYLFIYLLGLGTIALDPTFGSFTLLELVSHLVNRFLWWKCLDCLDLYWLFWCFRVWTKSVDVQTSYLLARQACLWCLCSTSGKDLPCPTWVQVNFVNIITIFLDWFWLNFCTKSSWAMETLESNNWVCNHIRDIEWIWPYFYQRLPNRDQMNVKRV